VERVDFKLRDIAEGFDETEADAFFLDVANPYDYIHRCGRRSSPEVFSAA